MNFGRAERLRYKKFWVPIYGNFLQKCYCKSFSSLLHNLCTNSLIIAPEECRSRALAPEEGFEGLESNELEADGANFDSYNTPVPSTQGGAVSAASILEEPEVEMGPANEESPVTLGSRPLSPQSPPPQPLPPRPISPPLPMQRPPRPVSPAASFLDSPPPPSRPVSPAPSHLMSPPGFTISPRRISPLPHAQPIVPSRSSASPTPRHVSPSIHPISPLPSHARPMSPPPAVIPPLSIFKEKRKSARAPVNPSKRIRHSTENEPTSTHRSGRVSVASAPPPTHQARQRKATANSKPPTTSASRHPRNKMSSSSASKNSVLAWFSSSLGMLQSNEPPLGDRWAELMRLWTAFEEEEEFEERAKLLAKLRPVCISEWIGR